MPLAVARWGGGVCSAVVTAASSSKWDLGDGSVACNCFAQGRRWALEDGDGQCGACTTRYAKIATLFSLKKSILKVKYGTFLCDVFWRSSL